MVNQSLTRQGNASAWATKRILRPSVGFGFYETNPFALETFSAGVDTYTKGGEAPLSVWQAA
jgi:hypothetical protein